MQLIQRNDPHQHAQDLPPAENDVSTGYMGDCACAIVMWNPDHNGRYLHVRGYHGGGGLGNVNFASLFAGVPNLVTTRIYMVSGTLQNSFYAIDTNRTEMRNAAIANGLGNAYLRCNHGYSIAAIDRNGNIT